MKNNIYILDRFEDGFAVLIQEQTDESYAVKKEELNSEAPVEGDLFILEDGILKPKEKDGERKKKLSILFNSLKKK